MVARKSIKYEEIYKLHQKDTKGFNRNLKAYTLPKHARVTLTGLFQNPVIHDYLLRLERFPGVWINCTWGSLSAFNSLLECVPEELARFLDRAIRFWDDVASLCKPEEDKVREDTETPSRIAGWWPECCQKDRTNLQEQMVGDNPIFPAVTDEKRAQIGAKIRGLKYRVPSLYGIGVECRAISEISKRLKSCENIKLEKSILIVNGQTASSDQYRKIFLAAGRACYREDNTILKRNVARIFHNRPEELGTPDRELLDLTTIYSRVSAPPDGIWTLGVSPLFQFDLLDKLGKGHGPGEKLRAALLIKDFFESFFGSAQSGFDSVVEKNRTINGNLQSPRPLPSPRSLGSSRSSETLVDQDSSPVSENTSIISGKIGCKKPVLVRPSEPPISLSGSLSIARFEESLKKDEETRSFETGSIEKSLNRDEESSSPRLKVVEIFGREVWIHVVA